MFNVFIQSFVYLELVVFKKKNKVGISPSRYVVYVIGLNAVVYICNTHISIYLPFFSSC